ITVQLVQAATDRHLWAETYERDLRDVLALQSEVARAIARKIQIKLTPQDQARLASARPVQREAYEAYLQGLYYWNQRTEPALWKSLEHFRRAVERDPNYALGYAGLAETYNVLGGLGVISIREAHAQSVPAAMKALSLDDTLAEAHVILADHR